MVAQVSAEKAHCSFHFPAVCLQSCARVPDFKGWRILCERPFTTARKGYGKPVRLRRSESERPSVLFVIARKRGTLVAMFLQRRSGRPQYCRTYPTSASPQVGGCTRIVGSVCRIVELDVSPKSWFSYTHVSYDQCICVSRC